MKWEKLIAFCRLNLLFVHIALSEVKYDFFFFFLIVLRKPYENENCTKHTNLKSFHFKKLLKQIQHSKLKDLGKCSIIL